MVKERVQWGLKTKLPREFMVLYVPRAPEKIFRVFFVFQSYLLRWKVSWVWILGFKYLQTQRCFGSLGFMLSKQKVLTGWVFSFFEFTSILAGNGEILRAFLSSGVETTNQLRAQSFWSWDQFVKRMNFLEIQETYLYSGWERKELYL